MFFFWFSLFIAIFPMIGSFYFFFFKEKNSKNLLVSLIFLLIAITFICMGVSFYSFVPRTLTTLVYQKNISYL